MKERKRKMLTEKFLAAIIEAFIPYDRVISREEGIVRFEMDGDSFYIDKDLDVFLFYWNQFKHPKYCFDLTSRISCGLCGTKTIVTKAGNLKKDITALNIIEILEQVAADGVNCDFLFEPNGETLCITTIETPYSIKSIFEDNFDKQNDPNYYNEEELDNRDCLECGTGQWTHN